MDKLTAKTDGALRRKNDLITLSCIFLVLSAAAVFLMYENLKSLIITEALLAIALGWTYYRSVKNGDVTLNFKGDSLDVIYSDGRRYNIKDVDRSYFTLTQTVKDKERDIGTLSVASTNFRVQYIKEFSAVRGYVNTHFEKKNTAGIYYFDDDGEEE